MSYKKYLILLQITFYAFSIELISQPNLTISPNQVKFEDIFNRIESVYLINEGNSILSIDSINYNRSFYSITFQNNLSLPFIIQPEDSVMITIALSGFYFVTFTDTSDTVFIYNNGTNSPEPLRVRTDFFEDDFGIVAGNVSDGVTSLDSTTIYFFYNGIYLFDTSVTDDYGNYQIELPEGEYIIAAERQGYRVFFQDSTFDPYFARLVDVPGDNTTIINFNLKKLTQTDISVSGIAYDSLGGITLDKGVVVVRKGTHTPTLLKQNALEDDLSVYAGFIKNDGSYNIPVEDSSYYFVQGYSDYFLPTYYNSQNAASVFWQNADSVFVNQTIVNKNLYLARDSSYGGGGAYGSISLPLLEAQGFDGITLLAKSIENNELYSYNFGKEDGSFHVNSLPYGSYQLVAQKVGLPNALSNTFIISPQNQFQFGLNIQFTLTDVKEEENIIPNEIQLYANYPNPFNPSTTISFSLPSSQIVKIKVYNLLGEEVADISNQIFSAGLNEVNFNANGLASGVYIVSLEANTMRLSQKIALLK